MPPTTRAVQLRWLLVPPLPCRPHSSLHRPQVDAAACRGPVSLRPVQCRPLHLYKTARARTTLGQHKVLTFLPYEVPAPSASAHRVNLVSGRMNLVAENITLQELYDNHVKAGHMLYLTEPVKKKKAENLGSLKSDPPEDLARNFAIVKAHSTYAQLSKKKGKISQGPGFGPLKILNLNLSSAPHYAQITLDRAYQFIDAGSPVEFRIRFAGAALNKVERLRPGDPEVWPWMHDHFPHLRPDFILKSMPEGTSYMIQPVTDNRIVQFVVSKTVMGMPAANLMKRLFTVKRSVQESVKSGRQAQLPMVMRQQLYEDGQTEYSAASGIPYGRLQEKYGLEKAEEVAADDVSEQRYLFPTAKVARRAWMMKMEGQQREAEQRQREKTEAGRQEEKEKEKEKP